MEIQETRKYRTLKLIVIGILMTIDIFIIYLLSIMITNGVPESTDKYDLVLLIFILLSIPSFLLLTFKKVSFTATTIDISYFGFFRTTRHMDGLNIYLTSGDKELRILTKDDKYLASLYDENISNFELIKKYLSGRLIADQPKKSKLNWLYICWTTIGLVLGILTFLD